MMFLSVSVISILFGVWILFIIAIFSMTSSGCFVIAFGSLLGLPGWVSLVTTSSAFI